MSFARAATLPKGIGRTVFRRAGASSRNQSFKQVGRRGYASGHGHGSQQSSEIPWIIGSAAVTIPAAGWLLQQGPKKSDHGHDAHHEEKEEKAEEDQEEEQPQEEESTDDSKDDSKDDAKDDSKDEGKDEGKEETTDGEDGDKEASSDDETKEKDSDDSGKEKGGDNKSEDGKSKGPGEGQKGDRKPTETKSEKDSQGDKSGAKHPYLDDPEKSKKGAGPTETAKIHGTVDSRGGARGVGETGNSSN